MPYQTYALTTIEDVPAKIVDFITNNMPNWSAASSTAGPNGEVTCTIDMPARGADYPGYQFTFMALNGGQYTYQNTDYYGDNYIHVFFTGNNPASFSAKIFSPAYPIDATTASPRAATQVHLFGWDDGTSPSTAIGVVIEFGPGRYRHCYFGRIDTHGTVADGAIIAGMNVPGHYFSSSSYNYVWYSSETKWLFSGLGQMYSTVARDNGGVFVGATAPAPQERVFSGYGAFTHLNSIPNNLVFGGPIDGPLLPFEKLGYSPSTGKALVVPIELYIAATTPDIHFSSVGHPDGVYFVNMKNLTPGQTYTVGTRQFIVFPAARKELSTDRPIFDTTVSDRFPVEENSGIIGYAYEIT